MEIHEEESKPRTILERLKKERKKERIKAGMIAKRTLGRHAIGMVERRQPKARSLGRSTERHDLAVKAQE